MPIIRWQIRCPAVLDQKVEKAVKDSEYQTRSELVRSAVRKELKIIEKKSKEEK